MGPQIILASASPRRRVLLDQIGVRYSVVIADIDETPLRNEPPDEYVMRMAADKSAVIVDQNMLDLPILAADTAVVCNGLIMGKPKHRQDAREMLLQLSGNTHEVYSAISLRGKKHWQALNRTEVTFRQLADEEISCYWESGEPADKAGAYAIQGFGGAFVKSITGSFSAVMGLPLFEVAEVLLKQGIKIFHD